MNRLLLAASSLLALAGCDYSYDTFDRELPKYKGQPVSAVVDRLGPPTSQDDSNGIKTYVWNVNGTGPASCEVRIIVSADERVMNTDYDGRASACTGLSRRLAGKG